MNQADMDLVAAVEAHIAAKDARIAELKMALREAIEWNWIEEVERPPEHVLQQIAAALGVDANSL